MHFASLEDSAKLGNSVHLVDSKKSGNHCGWQQTSICHDLYNEYQTKCPCVAEDTPSGEPGAPIVRRTIFLFTIKGTHSDYDALPADIRK